MKRKAETSNAVVSAFQMFNRISGSRKFYLFLKVSPLLIYIYYFNLFLEENYMSLDLRNAIQNGKTVLGIELGSTRIKAVLIGEDNVPIASGSHDWENSYVNNIWTYSLEEIWKGVQDSYQRMAYDVKQKYEVTLQTVGAIGFSGMMHGYMAFDKAGELLVPFRTWRNNITEQASIKLTEVFNYHIPQRWSIAHLYQAIMNQEEHIAKISFQTTLAGYIHWKLTGQKVLGVGEASGVFPIDLNTKSYNQTMANQFNELITSHNLPWKLEEILPKVLVAGENAGQLTEEGAKLLDVSGQLKAGIPLCPPEGDAGTGIVATNSVAKRTGNVSAGTSVFAMVVLEKELSKVYPEIDLVTTPTGNLVAMAHSNNCSSDLNAWVGVFDEFSKAMGMDVDKNKLYGTLYNLALQGDPDCGGLLAYGYLSGEHMTHFEEGRPLFVRSSDSNFNLANFMRVHLFTALGALKIGMDILLKQEGVKLDEILGHGGLFKTKGVGQSIMAAALNVPVSVMETAGEGGAWGIALLASYMLNKAEHETLEEYLNQKVFAEKAGMTISPDPKDAEGFEQFMKRYTKGLAIEKAAVANLN
jgi:sugar (pentulose or hexulose) kinase